MLFGRQGKEMRPQWLLLFFLLMEIKGIRSCLECDPKYFKDVIWLLDGLVPQNTPSRKMFLDRQLQELRSVSTRVHQGKKRLRLLDVRQTIQVREWLKEKLSNLKQKPWKGVFIFQGQLLELRQDLEFHLTETLKTFSDLACSEDCMMTEGPVLDCWNCLRITTPCFRGELCGDDDPMIAQQREISLFLALMMEAVGLGSIALLYYFCIIHRKKMKVKLEELKKNPQTKMIKAKK
ncbi:izumo sperm-egg fusion protein 3 [Monodelphis domestica]|uniref:IZUMO family member 3 n=1 Tax=Monodelphis domestica TaxID=13616 RepID=K7E4U9_MONDO|nr:izumo sperm-egg fusion protein 3 [Monodelphis domestica]